MNKRVGIILAGGMSRRYGRPKAFEEINGKRFFEIAYEVLSDSCEEVVIVTREQFTDWFPNPYHVIVDVASFRGCGPLAGIFSGMLELEANEYVVLPCDMPLIDDNIIKALIHKHIETVTIAKVDGRMQPLVSVWDRTMLATIEATLASGEYSMKKILMSKEALHVPSETLTSEQYRFINVNTAEQFEEMKRWLKS